MTVFLPRFLIAALLAVILIAVGTTGYVLIEGWPLNDGLYMAVITLTAVGYSEVQPLSEPGRAFTMLLLVGGITWMGLWFALITSLIVELDLTHVLRRRRTMREIERMKDHVIVCGGGRTGRQVLQELDLYGWPWVLVEHDPSHAEAIIAESSSHT